VRLVTEYQYQHVYQNGQDIVDPDWESPRDENGDPVDGISPASIIAGKIKLMLRPWS
jgi:hypothetical protein